MKSRESQKKDHNSEGVEISNKFYTNKYGNLIYSGRLVLNTDLHKLYRLDKL